MWRQRIRTNYWLWATCSVALLFAAGCVNWLPEAKMVAYWIMWAEFLSGEYGPLHSEQVLVLAMSGFLLFIPSIILGWITHAIVLALCLKTQSQVSH
jgi:hypothetical protein